MTSEQNVNVRVTTVVICGVPYLLEGQSSAERQLLLSPVLGQVS